MEAEVAGLQGSGFHASQATSFKPYGGRQDTLSWPYHIAQTIILLCFPLGRWRMVQHKLDAGCPDRSKEQLPSNPERQVHMLYCCQNHSGSPALAAPAKKKALTPCSTVIGFDAALVTDVKIGKSGAASDGLTGSTTRLGTPHMIIATLCTCSMQKLSAGFMPKVTGCTSSQKQPQPACIFDTKTCPNWYTSVKPHDN